MYCYTATHEYIYSVTMLCCPRDMGTEMADWLRAIKNKVTREVISRKLISGEPIDKSVTG